MSKPSVRNLEKRVERLGGSCSESAEAKLQAGAEMSWLIHHLTEDEGREECRLIMSLEKAEVPHEQAEARFEELLSKARERAAHEPPGASEEYKQKCIRAETLRRTQRLLTGDEGDELRALNAWFDDSADCVTLSMLGRIPDWVRG